LKAPFVSKRRINRSPNIADPSRERFNRSPTTATRSGRRINRSLLAHEKLYRAVDPLFPANKQHSGAVDPPFQHPAGARSDQNASRRRRDGTAASARCIEESRQPESPSNPRSEFAAPLRAQVMRIVGMLTTRAVEFLI
jgi:hypothetical protein